MGLHVTVSFCKLGSLRQPLAVQALKQNSTLSNFYSGLLIIFFPHIAALSKSERGYDKYNRRASKDCPKGSSVTLHQRNFRVTDRRVFRYRRSNSSSHS